VTAEREEQTVNRKELAALIGVSPRALDTRVRKHGLERALLVGSSKTKAQAARMNVTSPWRTRRVK
jgi:carbamoylphosphate synthase small subunit